MSHFRTLRVLSPAPDSPRLHGTPYWILPRRHTKSLSSAPQILVHEGSADLTDSLRDGSDPYLRLGHSKTSSDEIAWEEKKARSPEGRKEGGPEVGSWAGNWPDMVQFGKHSPARPPHGRTARRPIIPIIHSPQSQNGQRGKEGETSTQGHGNHLAAASKV